MNQTPPGRPSAANGMRATIVPANVLKALIGQSQRRCESYAGMLLKLETGMEQLRFEAEKLAQGSRPEPDIATEALQYFQAIGAAFVRSREHLEAQAHYELRLQDTLQRWLAIAAPPGPGMRRVFPGRSPGAQLVPQRIPPFRAPAPSREMQPRPEARALAPRPSPLANYLPRAPRHVAQTQTQAPAPEHVVQEDHQDEVVVENVARLPAPKASWGYGGGGSGGLPARTNGAHDGSGDEIAKDSEEQPNEPA